MLGKTAAWMIILLIGFLSPSLGLAQTAQPTTAPAPEKRHPILMRWKTLLGIHYYYLGVDVKGYDGLKNIISPLNDPEASRLLTNSRDENQTGAIFTVGGLAMMVGGVVIAGVDPNAQKNPDVIDGQETAGLVVSAVGLVGAVVGAFKITDSKADEFNAVQRYNEVVHGDDQTTWNLPKPGSQTELLTLKF